METKKGLNKSLNVNQCLSKLFNNFHLMKNICRNSYIHCDSVTEEYLDTLEKCRELCKNSGNETLCNKRIDKVLLFKRT